MDRDGPVNAEVLVDHRLGSQTIQEKAYASLHMFM